MSGEEKQIRQKLDKEKHIMERQLLLKALWKLTQAANNQPEA